MAWPTLANEINIITTRCLGFYTCAEREQDWTKETKILFLVRRDTRGTWFLKLIMQFPWEVDPRSSNRELPLRLRLTSLFKVLIAIRLSDWRISAVSAFSNYWSLIDETKFFKKIEIEIILCSV